MIRSYFSEWLKIRRPAMILGAGGTMLVFSVLVILLRLRRLGATGGHGPLRGEALTNAQVAASSGFALLVGSEVLIGVVALGLFAIAIGMEYSTGTLRNLLVRQPDRVRFLAGKLLALGSFTVLAAIVAYCGALVTALILVPTHGASTSAWFTGPGIHSLLTTGGNMLLATLAWGILGAVLAILLRSSALAIGVGLAYALVVENLINAAWSDAQQWLPGDLMGIIAQGGTSSVSYTSALLLVGLYVAAALVVVGAVFRIQDVTV
jgi:ABC-2 type transport system permease protein